MLALDVPAAGVALRRSPTEPTENNNPGSAAAAKPTQFIRLSLAQNTLKELIQSLQDDQKARIRLGKHQTLYYGSKTQHLRSAPETVGSELYRADRIDQENVYFAGVLSHTMEVQNAKEATAATDQALAKLEQSLNAFERGKESKKTHMITSIHEVKALQGGSASRRAAAAVERGHARLLQLEKDRLWKNTPSRSATSSPALGAARSPASAPPLALSSTSAPDGQNKDRQRLEALKVPFMHLLAIRAVSAKFLARQTRSSLEDCVSLAQKYGVENRINREKFDLRDKAYRELDVWNFPYPSQEDRQEAIENAISAFDRMRISRSDKLWQTLLPKEERGKGKVLSRLNLRTGPVKKTEPPPRIQVHASDEPVKDGYHTGNETDRGTAGGLTPVPTPASAAVPSQMKRSAVEKDKDTPAKRPAPAKNKNVNSTLTGRITKKTDRRPTPKTDGGKFKSAEFVHDSDEDEDIEGVDTTATQQPRSDTARPPVRAEKETGSSRPSEPTPALPVPKSKREPPPATSSKPRLSESQSANSAAASKRPASARPSNPTSPRKPSPLGSAQPTNASDVASRSPSSQHNSSSSNSSSSSSSSSPLIMHVARANKAATTTTITTTAPSSSTPSARPNRVGKPTESTNPLKRKAEADRPPVRQPPPAGRVEGSLEHKRRRAPSTSSGSTGSTGSVSPSTGQELLLQQLQEKSRLFKQYYARYRSLHDELASHPDPPRPDLDKLHKQHVRLQRMKKEIWEEDQRLRERR